MLTEIPSIEEVTLVEVVAAVPERFPLQAGLFLRSGAGLERIIFFWARSLKLK